MRRIVRPPMNSFCTGQPVRVDCDSLADAVGVVVKTERFMRLEVFTRDGYHPVTAPGVVVRVTKDNGDWCVGDELQIHEASVTAL